MAYERYKDLTLGIGDFNGYVEKKVFGFEGVHGGNGIKEQNLEDRMLLEFCNQMNLCVANTWFKKKEKRKVTYSSDGNKIEIDFVLVEKESRKFLKNVKVIPWELQHKLVVVDVKKENLHEHETEHAMQGMEIKRKRNKGKI